VAARPEPDGRRTAAARPVREIEPLDGVIPISGLVGDTVAQLGRRIVGGDWLPGETIPREADLCAELNVSRAVIREAFRILGAKGLIRSRTSDGTRVMAREEWRLLDPDVMDWRIKAGDTRALLLDLLRVRAVLEPGVVREATLHASPQARARIAAAWAAKVDCFGHPHPDLAIQRQRFIDTDLEFHRAFLASVESPLLSQLFGVVEAALRLLFDLQMRARGYETEMIGMEEGHEAHARVIEAWAAGDALGAEAAMRDLIGRAMADAQRGLKRLAGP
jgi:GntR family transcriptional regulator, galactonate operon transcriptional repressor